MTDANPLDPTAPAVIVSCDSHVGPLLKQQLRDYCPRDYLDEFDAFVVAHEEAGGALQMMFTDEGAGTLGGHPNLAIAGHHDPQARLRDMDSDGVAAEVIFHMSLNGEPLPFIGGGLESVEPDQFELGAVSYQIYNRWLADFCSADPERLLGLAYLPMWDIEASVKELGWAREAGLRAVAFPPPGRAGHLEYNNPAWEPFWSACEDLDMALSTHTSGAVPCDYHQGPGTLRLVLFETGGWMARRAVWWMIHGRVFENHPGLKLIITEQYEGWYLSTMRELDSIGREFSDLPKAPSEYVRSNVFLGASFPSTDQVEEAHREGYSENVLWGRDYPHIEGAFQVRDDPDAEPICRLALRHAFSRVPAREALQMVGQNSVRIFGLDGDYLTTVAGRIDAPSAERLGTEPESLPEVGAGSNAFRGQAGLRPAPSPQELARM